jgi:Ubiquitin carboxyl-terminal hydrolase
MYPHEQSCDLLDCLDEFTRMEKVDGVECPACTYTATMGTAERLARGSVFTNDFKMLPNLPLPGVSKFSTRATVNLPLLKICRRTMDKFLFIAKPPEALCFHLHRLTPTERKVYTLVRFPLELDLRPYCRVEADLPPASTCLRSCSPPNSLPETRASPAGRCRGGAGGYSPLSALSTTASRTYLFDTQLEPSVRHHSATEWSTASSPSAYTATSPSASASSSSPPRFVSTAATVGCAAAAAAAAAAASDISCPYQLVAVIVHHGTGCNGHFETYRRQESSSGQLQHQWIHLSDEKVRLASLDEVLGAPAYMLFYELESVLPSL